MLDRRGSARLTEVWLKERCGVFERRKSTSYFGPCMDLSSASSDFDEKKGRQSTGGKAKSRWEHRPMTGC